MASSHSHFTIQMPSGPATENELIKYRSVLINRISKIGGKENISESASGRRTTRSTAIIKSPRITFIQQRSHDDVSVVLEAQVDGKVKTVYLYFQLQNIANLPQDADKRYFLNLQHKTTNFSETKEITGNRRISSFSIPIQQDVDIANLFSDEPLLVTVTALLTQDDNDNEETEAPSLESANILTIAQGQIDIVPFLTTRRSITNRDVFLYPTSVEFLNIVEGTCKTAWHIYSLMPILKNVDFNNMIFLTLESIYNASSDIIELWNDLGVSISFRSKIADDNGEFVKNQICIFKLLNKCTIAEQDTKYKWASIAKRGEHNLGQATECSLTLHKIFNDLLCTENVDFGFDKISIHSDVALVCNLMRRYILNEEWSNILEGVIAFDEQEIVVEVYQRSEPSIILLRGSIDLSIFLYPRVNSCRFAVQLRPVEEARTSKTKLPARWINSYNKDGEVTFGIVSICTLQPITENITIQNTLGGKSMEIAKICVPEKYLKNSSRNKSNQNLCAESYKSFDADITKLTDYLIRKEVQNFDDAKGFLCCQKNNLTQKIMKLIACDFNVKVPTKDTIEFSNLMTYVYKSLENRCYEFLKNLEKNNNRIADTDQVKKILLCISTIKMLKECGADDLAQAFEKKLKKLETTEFLTEGYIFLYNMEKQNFSEASKHIQKSLEEKFKFGDYYDGLLEIYINYMEISKSETTYNQALQYLLSKLEDFSGRFLKEPSIWILLYCLYKDCGYKPGMSFTRWRYENISNPRIHTMLPELPMSLWDMYCKRDLELTTKKSRLFYETFQLFSQLGLYKFTEIIFKEIQNECTEAEKYFINTTLRILLKVVNDKYHVRSFQGTENIIFQSHINGHLYYQLGNIAAANDCYALLTNNVENLENIEIYQMSLMRHGTYFFQLDKYKDAINQYKQCTHIKSCAMQAHFNIGKAYYRLGKFDKAEHEFALCTHFGVHVPDVWAYLALVNLKTKNITNALESWKYAQVNPDNDISKEIYEELNKINLNDLTLISDYNKCGN
ncbi:uncharacterized protein [Eurosta solidaginis]|uniref:uncharacterized protein n=1 Tax=Eurosta solidaginis TaxID=178769 RepID=UPI003531701D